MHRRSIKRTITGGIALTGMLALSAGCVAEPESGIVTEKEFEEAHSSITQDCRTTTTTRNGRTTSNTTCTPRTVYYPECYEIDYEDPATDETGEDCVSKALYDALEIGDEYRKGMKPDDVA